LLGTMRSATVPARFAVATVAARSLDFRIVDMLAHSRMAAHEVLRTAVSALSFYDADEKDNSHDANVRKCYT